MNDLVILEKQIDRFSKLWRDLGLSVTPKVHIMECHLLPFLTKIHVLGLFSEEAIERTHKEAHEYAQRSNSNEFETQEKFTEQWRNVAQSAGVQKVKKTIEDTRKRKFKEASLVRRDEKREEKVQARKTKREKGITLDNNVI